MPIHYIYEDLDGTCLCQGDIIDRSKEIVALLRKYHASFADHPDFKHFLVLTHTCDLFRRNAGHPSARYITISAVRPIRDAILFEAKKYQDWWQEPQKIIDSKSFDQLLLFTESLLDNNIKNYFYLHEDVSLSMSLPCCAFLSLSVALKATHYDTLLNNKIAQLKEPFRAKLGWLVGDMYSRVGTKEWDEHYGKNKARKESSSLLKGIFINLDKEKIEKGLQKLSSEKDLTSYSPQEIYEHIVSTKLISTRKRFAKRTEELLDDLKLIDPICSKLVQEIRRDKQLFIDLMTILEKACTETSEVENLTKEAVRVFEKSLNSILTDAKFSGRSRLTDRIAMTFKQDTIMRSILVSCQLSSVG
jgi:hypothetical protein